MVEYLYDAIRVSSGHDATITAKVTDDDGYPITEGCGLMVYDDDLLLFHIDGEYIDDTWYFTISPEQSRGLNGRYWYCICIEDKDLCFKQPIYFLR